MKFKFCTFTLILIGTIILLTTYTGCQQKETNIIKIGAILPLTGNQSFFGENERKGLLFALEKINQERERDSLPKLQIIFEDSKGNPADAITSARKLLEFDKVRFIFTSLSGVSSAISSLTKEKEILQFAFAMDDRITQNNNNVFRTYPGTQELAIQLSSLIDYENKSKIAILYPQQSGYESIFKESLIMLLKQKNITITLDDAFDMNNLGATFRGLVNKLKIQNIETIYIGAYYNQMPEIFKILKESNMLNKLRVLTEYNLQIAVSLKLVEESILNNVEVVLPAYGLYENSEKNNRILFGSYFSQYNEYPNYDVAFAYDALSILNQAIINKGCEMDSIKTYMKTVKNYDGMSGNITIDENNNWQTQWITGYYQEGIFYTKQPLVSR